MPEAAAVDEVALMSRGWTWPYDESANGAEQTSTREPSNSIDELMSQPAAAAQEQEKQALQILQRGSNDANNIAETNQHGDIMMHADADDDKTEQPAESHGEQQPYARASLARASLSSPRLSLAVAESAWKTITARLKPRPSAAVDARRRLLEDSADGGGVVLFSRENDARRKEQQEAEERSQHVSLQSRYLYIARAKAEAKAKARAEKRATTAASVESALRERVLQVQVLFGEEPASDSELPEEIESASCNRWGTPFQDGEETDGHRQDEEDEEEDQARDSEREEADTELVAAPPVCVLEE